MKNAKARKSLKLAVSGLVCFAMMATSCFAYRIDYAGGDSNFNLSGKTEEAVAGQIVTLKVVNGSDAVVFTRQTETNSLGEYSFEFNVLEGEGGDIVITVNEGDAPEALPMYKSTIGEIEAAIEAVNDFGLYDAMGNDATLAKVLQIDAEVADGSILATYVDGKASYANFAAFRAAYKNGVFLNELAKVSADEAELYALLEECGLDPAIRAERLTLADFAAIADALEKI